MLICVEERELSMISRREFLEGASAAAVCVAGGGMAFATPLNLPLGLQLYSVREQLAKDYEGTLLQVGSLGYREVEAAGFYQRSAEEVQRAMTKANLQCVSAHHPFAELQQHFDEILAFHKQLGVHYLLCSSPGFKQPSSADAARRTGLLTLDDWKWNIEQFNAMGEKTAAAGVQFGYHNHVHEFAAIDGVVPYTEILRSTDPAKVTLELDCGWAIVAGAKPVDLLRDYPGRFSMLHVKDFKLPQGAVGAAQDAKVTELGRGTIDYRPILDQAAKTQKIKHMFVEQEAFDMPYMESLKVDAAYMRQLNS